MADRAVIERYVGLPYRAGEFDCADLAMRVQREVYGRTVTLPQDRPRPVHLLGMVRAIADLHGAVAERRRAGEPPQDGDGVLLGLGNRSAAATHIGVVAVFAGEPWVLHNDAFFGSSMLTRLRDLERGGWRLHGVYRWLP